MDDDGATDTTTQTVTVNDIVAEINLSTTGYKVKGLHTADLVWSGSTATMVDIYRDNVLIATVSNDGFHTDNINLRGSGTYVYRVCEAGTAICSNDAITEI
jgi:thermitase